MARNLNPSSYLPHWLFDYHSDFYIEQDKLATQFRHLDETNIPSWDEMDLIGINPFPLLIYSKRDLPDTWLTNLTIWKKEFINLLVKLPIQKLSLPYLFMSILRHFLSKLSDQDKDYSPSSYREILYTTYEYKNPLKLYDPLNTINDFCDTLQSVWNYREKANLNTIKIFKFNGRGILTGKRFQSDKEIRLLAYCGGKAKNNKGAILGLCGHAPLIIGKDENCPKCGYLICGKDNCHFCSSENCKSYKERMNKKHRNSNLRYLNATNSYIHQEDDFGDIPF